MRKKLLFSAIIILIVMICGSNVLAADDSNVSITDDSIMEQGKNWLKTGENNQPRGAGFVFNLPGLGLIGSAITSVISASTGGSDPAGTNNGQFSEIAGLLTGIGIFVIAIVGVILGIRLMFAKPEAKAKSKEALIIYLVGCFIIFGALAIWRILISILDGDYLY